MQQPHPCARPSMSHQRMWALGAKHSRNSAPHEQVAEAIAETEADVARSHGPGDCPATRVPLGVVTSSAVGEAAVPGGRVAQLLKELNSKTLAHQPALTLGRGPCEHSNPPSARMQQLIRETEAALGRANEEPMRFEAELEKLRRNDASGGEELCLANIRIFRKMDPEMRDHRFRDLAEALRENTAITSLNLNRICANDLLAEELAKALEGNRSLASLSLETNDITGKGVEALARLLRRGNTALRELRLVNQMRPIPTAAQHAMAFAVAANGCVTVCSLDCRDKAAREVLDKALARNFEARRLSRKAAAAASAEAFAAPLPARQQE